MVLCMEIRAGGEFPCPSWVNLNGTSLGGAVGVVGQSGSEVCARLGHAQAGAEEPFLLDRGRYRISEKRSPFGGSSPPVLRAVGQAGQLSGGGESVVVHRAWQCADRLAAVLAGAMG